MRFQRFFLGLTAAFLLAQASPAQVLVRQGVQGVAAAKSFLDLNDQQVQQLVQLRGEEREALQPIREQIRTKREALATASHASTPNPVTVGQLVLDLQKLRDQVRAVNEGYHAKALALLTPAQAEKLEPLEQVAQRAARIRPVITGATELNLLLPPQPTPAGAAKP